MTHICVSNLIIIGSDNALSPGRRQAIIWTNAGILLIEHLGTNFSEMLIEILIFSFKKIHLKLSSGKWRPFCLGLNVLTDNLNVSTGLHTRAYWEWNAGIYGIIHSLPIWNTTTYLVLKYMSNVYDACVNIMCEYINVSETQHIC